MTKGRAGNPRNKHGNQHLPDTLTHKKFVSKWTHTRTENGRLEFFTTNIPTQYAETLEFWSQLLVTEKKIPTNSKFEAARYAMKIGITYIDMLMKEKYGESGDA